MPLQIRRGTNAERGLMTVPLAQGELLYVTDDQRLYIGNGSTLGGVQITGYTDGDAKDAAAAIFTSGSHTGISFTYNTATNQISARVSLTNYNGFIDGDLQGSVFADNSTRLIDGTNGKFNLAGTINTNIVPDADSAYDLGSSSYKFKDLYLSGSSIHLGNATITSTGTAVNLPAGSLIGGKPIGVPGGDLNVNIVGDDSTVIVNTTTEVVTAQGGFVGNLTGYVRGDVKGSVFGDDSTILVDSVSSALRTANLTLSGNKINAGSSMLIVETSSSNGLSIHGITDGSLGTQNAALEINGSKGTIIAPTDTVAGDFVSRISFAGWHGGDYQTMGSIVAGWSATADFADPNPATDLFFTVNNGSTSSYARFSSVGVFYAPQFMTGSYPGSGTYPTIPTGVAGVMIFDSVTKKFMGYDGTSWNILG